MLPTFSYFNKALSIWGMWVVYFFKTQTPDFTRHYCYSTKDPKWVQFQITLE